MLLSVAVLEGKEEVGIERKSISRQGIRACVREEVCVHASSSQIEGGETERVV